MHATTMFWVSTFCVTGSIPDAEKKADVIPGFKPGCYTVLWGKNKGYGKYQEGTLNPTVGWKSSVNKHFLGETLFELEPQV